MYKCFQPTHLSSFVDLRSQADHIMDQALAPSTRKTYKRSMNLFQSFAASIGKTFRQCLEAKNAELWLTHLSSRGLNHTTIRSHLSAIKHHCIRYDIPHGLDSQRIHLLLKGLAKRSARPAIPTAAITTHHMKLLKKASKSLLSKKKHYQFMAIMAVAFYGFLRPSEYCTTLSDHHLKWDDVQFSKKKRKVRLTLKSYKHSINKSTINLNSARVCCPVYWLKRYRQMFTTYHGEPLFDISAKDFRTTLRNLCEVAKIKSKLTPHSFRHRGASWASKQGWPDARIRAHGRWKSDAYKRYVRAF